MLDLYSSDRAWMEFAACTTADPEAWFPAKGSSTREAKQICNGRKGLRPCPVRSQCLEYALSHDDRFGVWGGKSDRERRKLKRRAT
jgi:WhiB family redox-sensing transcriptional regulator